MPLHIPPPQDVLSDPTMSEWVKSALRWALVRDPVDALNDAELLAAVLDAHLRHLLAANGAG